MDDPPVDIAVDFMDMTDDRTLWTRLVDVRSGFVPIAGHFVVVGDDDAEPAVAQIFSVDIEGGPTLKVLDGPVKPELATSNADPAAPVETQLIGVDHSVLDATDASIDGIASPVAFESAANVAYIGDALATDLGVTPPTLDGPGLSIVTIDGLAFQVLGVLRSPQRLTETAGAVVIPRLTAEELSAYELTDYSMIIETAGGAAQNVGADIPLVLASQRAEPYVVDVPPDANQFRRRVEGNIQALVLAMAALSGLVGAISIASTAYSGVVERTGEFGLRRAFGAKPRHIRLQVILETLPIAMVVAVCGEILGLLVSLAVSMANGWATIVDGRVLLVIPIGAAILGVLASIIPARKASRIDSSMALRQVCASGTQLAGRRPIPLRWPSACNSHRELDLYSRSDLTC